MALTALEVNDTRVSDLSPLAGLKPDDDLVHPAEYHQGSGRVRGMKSLTNIGVGWGERDQFSPEEFWQKYDAGRFGQPVALAATASGGAITTFNDPAFKKWEKEVAALPAENKWMLSSKLQALNPGFDGNETHKIEDGVVTELTFISENVTDLSPVRALSGLNNLTCRGPAWDHHSQLSDLSPLYGMKLTTLNCADCQVTDLSPLKGIRLSSLDVRGTAVFDLSPLQGLPLMKLACCETSISDLSPLKGMHLEELNCRASRRV